MADSTQNKKPFKIVKDAYLECDPDVRFINTLDDFMELLGSLFTTRKVIIYQKNLNPDFFDLSTGFAGEILQKLVNYQVQTAFVVDKKSIKSERFQELINETSVNDDYRFFQSRKDAVLWLSE